ncbi:nuclear transport factor 2 family protein [Tateyamaria sp. syn59]|uniref:nuclear transport factor 2 family protein n=1 Tax=Tateyamaria sp. syn59 TaxID=2576942 RepID=UPI0011BD96B0|nr:nuclear transport factor 2 family protein [Tateyamaria sp. syn59]
MPHTITAPLAATIFATVASASVEADSAGGTPITVETLVAYAEMTRIADAADAAVDAKNWTLARSFFTDETRVDFTSLTGGAPATIAADDLIAGWAGNLTDEKTSFHLRGNHHITFQGDAEALMVSHGYARNQMERGALPENGGDPLWEVWGTYEHGFTLTEDGWRLDAMRFVATAQRGNAFVRDTPGR